MSSTNVVALDNNTQSSLLLGINNTSVLNRRLLLALRVSSIVPA